MGYRVEYDSGIVAFKGNLADCKKFMVESDDWHQLNLVSEQTGRAVSFTI